MLKYADYVNSYLTTPQMVRDLVNFHPDSYTGGMCICDYNASTHNLDLSPYLLADGTNDASQYLLGNPQIVFSDANDIQRTATFQFDGKIKTQIAPIKTLVQLFRCYYDWNDNQILKVPRGFFIPSIPDEEILNDDGDSVLDCTGDDLTKILQDIYPLHAVAMPQGMNIKVAAKGILMMDNRTPADGGRSPSGVAVAGGSQYGLPSLAGPISGTYTSSGVDVTTYGTDSATGYKKSPDGVYGFVFYNPYGGARADATTHAPIDPWTGAPMLPLPSTTSHAGGATNIWLSSKSGIAYKTNEGVFYKMNSTTTLDLSFPWDVFNDSPLPAGLVYKQPDILNPPSGTIGTILPPLASFPGDYNGVQGAFQPTPMGGGPVVSGNPDGMDFGYVITLAERMTPNTFLCQTGVYSTAPGISSVDVQNPGANQTKPQLYPGLFPYYVDGPLATGQTFAAATWTVNMRLQGFGIKSGSVGISCDVYHKEGGVYNHVGSLGASGQGQPFSSPPVMQDVWLTCSGGLPSFTTGASGQIAFKFSISVFSLVADFDSGNTSIARLTIAEVTTGPGNYGQGSGSTTPSTTGTGIPWPDTNSPALAPNGCVCYGGNWPEARIFLPDTTMTLPTTNVWDKQTSLATKLLELSLLAGWNRFGIDEAGNIVTEEQDYYSTDVLPVIEKTYDNILPQTDSFYIYPLTQRLIDQQNMANTIELTANSNQTGEGIVSIMSNDAPTSPLAYTNSGRRIIRIFSDDALGTQEQVDTEALQRLYAAAEAGEALEIQGPTDPFFSRRNHVNVIHQLDDLTRNIDGTSNPYRVNAWSEELQNPVQRVICGRTVAVLDSGVISGGTAGIGSAIGEPVGA